LLTDFQIDELKGQPYLAICCDPNDENTARFIKSKLSEQGISCWAPASSTDTSEETQQRVLQAWGVVVILSQNTLDSTHLHDLVQQAKEHHKYILPVTENRDLNLHESQFAQLLTTPAIRLSQSDEESTKFLIYSIHLNEKQHSLEQKLEQLHKRLQEAEEELKK
jgi:hypothetical protein